MSANTPWTPIDLEVWLIESFDNPLYVQPEDLVLRLHHASTSPTSALTPTNSRSARRS